MSKVLMYHYIRSFDKKFPYFNFLHVKDFKKQNVYLKKKKGFFDLNESITKNIKKNKILLTFDDGLKEHLNIAEYLNKKKIIGFFFIPSLPLIENDFLPVHKLHLIFGKYNSDQIKYILKKLRIKLNTKLIFSYFKKQKNFLQNKKNSERNEKIYLKTLLNNIDQKNPKVIRKIFNFCFKKSEQKKIFKNFYLNKKDIKKIDKLGMLIGSHGHSHKILSKMNYYLQMEDITKSLDFLSKIIKKKINYFCFPYGGFNMFNKNTLRILKRNGIIYSFNVHSRDWTYRSNNLFIPRYDCNEFKYGQIFNKKS